jgi:hypothetical protein
MSLAVWCPWFDKKFGAKTVIPDWSSIYSHQGFGGRGPLMSAASWNYLYTHPIYSVPLDPVYIVILSRRRSVGVSTYLSDEEVYESKLFIEELEYSRFWRVAHKSYLGKFLSIPKTLCTSPTHHDSIVPWWVQRNFSDYFRWIVDNLTA